MNQTPPNPNPYPADPTPDPRPADPIHDAQIDRTLAALNGANPPAGLEDRLLRTLEAQASVSPATRGWRRLLYTSPTANPSAQPQAPSHTLSSRPHAPTHTLSSRPERAARSGETRSSLPFGYAGPLAATLTLAAVACAVFLLPHRPSHRAASSPTEQAASPSPPAAQAETARPALPRHRAPRSATALQPRPPAAPPPAVTPATPQLSYEQLAADEMRAPSRLAPPLPLTQEERLFLGALRIAGLPELASLDRSSSAALDATEIVDFQRFFTPPPLVVLPPDPPPPAPASKEPTR